MVPVDELQKVIFTAVASTKDLKAQETLRRGNETENRLELKG